jgi:hypothetical protein
VDDDRLPLGQLPVLEQPLPGGQAGSWHRRRVNVVDGLRLPGHEWLPEPLPEPANADPANADPADQITLDESVTMAFLVVGRSPAACRQLASSARRRQ